MKLAIIGSRNCPPIDIEAHQKYIPDTIISGGAKICTKAQSEAD